MLNDIHRLNSLSKQSDSGESVSSNNLNKTICQNSSTKVLPKSKLKIKRPHQLNGSLPLSVYHRNIRGLRGKANKLLSKLYPTFPHILCLSEHHMNHLELQQPFLDNYKLGNSCCRTFYEKGGECIFVQESLIYVKIDLQKYCKDKDFEVCAIKIHFNTKSTYIISTYRAPLDNFDLFLSKLDTVLRKLYTVTNEYIIYGDINRDYLVDSDRKSRLEALLKTYNLTSAVNFPTRTQNTLPQPSTISSLTFLKWGIILYAPSSMGCQTMMLSP